MMTYDQVGKDHDNPDDDKKLEEQLSSGLGEAPAANFDSWKERHSDSLEHLNRFVTASRRKTSRTIQIVLRACMTAACIVAGIWWFNAPNHRNEAFADVLKHIRESKSLTWKKTIYTRVISADGKRTWIDPLTREHAYLSPGLFRMTEIDKDGKVQWYKIMDASQHKEMSVNPQNQTAQIRSISPGEGYPNGPFAWVEEKLKENSLEFVETRETKNERINVFRLHFHNGAEREPSSYDFWIDAKTKQLVRVRWPGANLFDPENSPERLNPAEEKWSNVSGVAHEDFDIVYNAKLAPSFFSMKLPAEYETNIQKTPDVSEEEMIEFLGALAKFNDNRFPETHVGLGGVNTEFNQASEKKKSERSPAEQQLIDLHYKYVMAGINLLPVRQFVKEKTVPGSFRYIGNGVPFGDSKRLVCWYRLKNEEAYRAVFGDLNVRNVAAKELPLPVDP